MKLKILKTTLGAEKQTEKQLKESMESYNKKEKKV